MHSKTSHIITVTYLNPIRENGLWFDPPPDPRITFGWANGVNLTRPTGLCTVKHPVSPFSPWTLIGSQGESLPVCVSEVILNGETHIWHMCVFAHVLVYPFMHLLWVDMEGKRVSFGRFIPPLPQQAFCYLLSEGMYWVELALWAELGSIGL